MTKEQLVELGLGEEQIKEVFKLNGIAIGNVRDKLTKAEEDAITNQSKITDLENRLQTGITEADFENLKNEKASLERKLVKAQEESTKQIDKMTFDHLLDNSLKSAGAKSLVAVKALMKVEDLKLVDGKIEGLDDEITRLTTEFDYQFNSKEDVIDESKPHFGKPLGGVNNSISQDDFKNMNYIQRLELKKNNVAEYNKLK